MRAVTNSVDGGVGAFYSVVNLARDPLPFVFCEIHRVLQPGGWLLLSFHFGEETRHVDEFLGVAVSLEFHFFQPVVVPQQLIKLGFDLAEMIQREPYEESVEAQTRRAHLLARYG